MNQNIAFRNEKLYCDHCESTATIKVPDNIDLSSPTSDEFIKNVRCTICKDIGYVRRQVSHGFRISF